MINSPNFLQMKVHEFIFIIRSIDQLRIMSGLYTVVILKMIKQLCRMIVDKFMLFWFEQNSTS